MRKPAVIALAILGIVATGCGHAATGTATHAQSGAAQHATPAAAIMRPETCPGPIFTLTAPAYTLADVVTTTAEAGMKIIGHLSDQHLYAIQSARLELLPVAALETPVGPSLAHRITLGTEHAVVRTEITNQPDTGQTLTVAVPTSPQPQNYEIVYFAAFKAKASRCPYTSMAHGGTIRQTVGYVAAGTTLPADLGATSPAPKF